MPALETQNTGGWKSWGTLDIFLYLHAVSLCGLCSLVASDNWVSYVVTWSYKITHSERVHW